MLEETPSSDARPAITVAVAASTVRKPHAEAMAARLAAPLGTGARTFGAGLGEAARLEPGAADVLVVLLSPGDDTLGLAEALDHADRIGLPRLVLTDPRSAEGMGLSAMPSEAPAESVAAMIRGMLSQQPEIRRLRDRSSGTDRRMGDLRSDLSRIRDELQLAAQVQREFLPRTLPDLPRVAMAAMWRPASWVSGDIYDARRLDEHHLGLLVADAVGHGVPAALLTMVLSRSIPMKEISGERYRIVPPAEAMARLNVELLLRNGRDTRFATAVYGVLDLRTLRLRLASAGHPPPAVLRGRGSVELVHASGGVLGVFEDERWTETEVDLRHGDRLLMHTDGLELAFPEDPASPQRSASARPAHLEVLRELLGEPDVHRLVQRLGERIDRAGDLVTPDDLTVLAMQIR